MKEVLEENEGFFMDFELFNEMKRALYQTFASGAIVIIASMARACGRKICAKIKPASKSIEEALSNFSDLMDKRNWGELSFLEVDFNNGTGRILIKNSFETRTEEPVSEKCCHFLVNFTAGFLSELFAKNIMVTEKKCVGKGDDHCEFEFHPLKKSHRKM
jgi:hypothetical protein